MMKSLLMLRDRGMGFSRNMKEGMMQMQGKPMEMPPRPASILSSRETEVAILLAKGLINKEIANRLNISLSTVISHRKNIMDKLNARSLADIIIHVVMNGLVRVEEL